LVGNVIEGGTIGRVMKAVKEKKFKVLFPVGLEKLIQIPIEEASKRAKRRE